MIADPNQMRKVLDLISNAALMQLVPKAPSTSKRASRAMTIAASIAVTDELGRRAECHRYFSRPFFTTKAHGTGLGLAVVGQIVRNHGSSIFVDNVEHRGARMTLTFPVVDTPRVRPAETAYKSAVGRR